MLLLPELEAFEYLVSEFVAHANLYELYADWLKLLRDSPGAIGVCDALDTFIEANIEEGQASHVEQAYPDLVATVQAGGE